MVSIKLKLKYQLRKMKIILLIDIGYTERLDMCKFFPPLTSDAIIKSLSHADCLTLNKYGIERRKGILCF